MTPEQILAKAIEDIERIEARVGTNEAAYRKQVQMILHQPGVRSALARARDAPETPAEKPPTRKRKTQTAD